MSTKIFIRFCPGMERGHAGAAAACLGAAEASAGPLCARLDIARGAVEAAPSLQPPPPALALPTPSPQAPSPEPLPAAVAEPLQRAVALWEASVMSCIRRCSASRRSAAGHAAGHRAWRRRSRAGLRPPRLPWCGSRLHPKRRRRKPCQPPWQRRCVRGREGRTRKSSRAFRAGRWVAFGCGLSFESGPNAVAALCARPDTVRGAVEAAQSLRPPPPQAPPPEPLPAAVATPLQRCVTLWEAAVMNRLPMFFQPPQLRWARGWTACVAPSQPRKSTSRRLPWHRPRLRPKLRLRKPQPAAVAAPQRRRVRGREGRTRNPHAPSGPDAGWRLPAASALNPGRTPWQRCVVL
jgi:hypothetical protein